MDLYSMTINEYLEVASSKSPTPGGGSVSAVAATNAAAMVSMVANLTIGKKGYEEHQEETQKILNSIGSLLEKLKELTKKDMEGFNIYMEAYRMKKDTEEDKRKREEALQKAAKNATLTPLEIAKTCLSILKEAANLSRFGNRMAISDVGVAAYLADAALKAALLSVDINLPSISDEKFVEDVINERAKLIASSEELKTIALCHVRERM